MLSYLKNLWKVSGTLPKYKYFSVYMLIWTGTGIAMFGYALLNLGEGLAYIFYYVMGLNIWGLIKHIFSIFVIYLVVPAVTIVNIRFFPFLSEAMKGSSMFNRTLKGEVKKGYEEGYNRVLRNGSGYRNNVRYGYNTVYVNTRTESASEFEGRANTEGISTAFDYGTGYFTNRMGLYMFSFLLYPLSFVLALIPLSRYVDQYVDQQQK